MHTKCLMNLIALITSSLILLSAPALADFAPLGRHHAPLGNGAGVGAASVSATGTFSTAVPLDLPKPRGDLPDPVAVVHHGGNQVGEAGVGWSIPLSYIFRSTSVSRRKPVFATTGNAPRPATRVFMSLGGSQMLMSLVGPNLYRPFASDRYSELRGPGPNESGPEGEWVFIDSAGRRYLFEKIERLDDPSLWLLTRVTDSVGNKVTLRYQVRVNSDNLAYKELNLIEVAHSYLAGADDCPKYRITLRYGADGGDDPVFFRADGAVEPVLGYRLDHGKVQVRRRLLERISVRANTDACEGFGQVLRTFQFSYAPDSDSGRLRLERVDVTGREDAGPLPVASYTYGSAKTGTGFEYKLARTVSYPAGTPSIGHMHVSEEEGQRKFETTSAWVDFTGDGRPDFVRPGNYDSPGALSHFVNRPDGTLEGVSDTVGILDNLTEQTRRELKSWAEGQLKSAVVESWREMIDWNGDGRMDIVEARGAVDKDHWLVSLSFPSSNGGVSWIRRQVNTYALRLALKHQGHEGIRDDEPLPLSRSQTLGDYHEEECIDVRGNGQVIECPPPWCRRIPEGEVCDPDVKPNHWNLPSETVTEWKLQDVNGDGFPDFVLNSNPISETMKDWPPPGTFADLVQFCLETAPPNFGAMHPEIDCWGEDFWRSRDWTIDTTAGNRLLVYYNNNGAGLANPALAYEFTIPVSPSVLSEAGACGVERWSVDTTKGTGDRTMICGFREINGDGLIDWISSKEPSRLNTGAAFDARSPEISIPGWIRQTNNREDICKTSADDPKLYRVRTEGELVDVTSDGIPDFVSWQRRPPRVGWEVHVGTGVGFGPAQPLQSLTGKFEISLVQETCKQKQSVTLAGLVDFDGDGSPDVVRPTPDNSLEIQHLGAGSGTLSAGRLTVVRNGYGGATHISYANAKADGKTAHQVPFPEVVVTQTREVDEKDCPQTSSPPCTRPTRSLDPVHFAYGEARLQYNPILARWTFPGYGRRVTVRGISSDQGSVTGTAIVEQYLQYLQSDELPPGHELERYVLAGRLKSQQLLVGEFIDASSVLDLKLLETSSWQGALDVEQAVLDTNTNPAAGEECGDIDPISFQPGSPTLCRSAAVIWLGETRSWRGTSPPPAPGIDQPAGAEAVERRSRVTKIDEFGRPRSIENENDTARTDDDACIYPEYATPVNTGLLGVLDAVSSIRVIECTEGFAFSGQRFLYDNLPEGQVSRGLPTKVVLERYNAITGADLGKIDAQDVSYDTYGNVEELSMARREDGGQTTTRTTTFRYDPFGLALSDVTSKASDGLAARIDFTPDPTSLLLQSVEDENGAIISFKHDSFGRPTRTTLIDPVDHLEYMLGETVYLGDDPEGPDGRIGRRISYRSFDAWVPAATYMGPTQGVRETTTYFDSFGRAGLSKTSLGVRSSVFHRTRLPVGRSRAIRSAPAPEEPIPDSKNYRQNRSDSDRLLRRASCWS